jgi:hypothetical protein
VGGGLPEVPLQVDCIRVLIFFAIYYLNCNNSAKIVGILICDFESVFKF